MGSAMARRIAPRHELRGYDVRPLTDAGLRTVAAPAELAAHCDVVLLALPSPVETRALFDDPAFRRAFVDGDATVVDMSTSDPASLRALAAELGPAGGRLLDAPVLGRPDRCGAWTLPVGGDPARLERVRATLDLVAARVEHVGPLGSGHTVKLLNNLMFAAINVATAEAIAACDALGMPPERFVDLVAWSGAATVSPLFRDLAPRMLHGGLETVFTLDLLAKDVALAEAMFAGAGAVFHSGRASRRAVAGAQRLGLGAEDSAALVDWYRRGAPE
jgi:3-hydroxyisobutyrate dehydrogenase